MFVACGKLPNHLVASRTIFVAKKGEPDLVTSYRPISIASVALRHFNRILAQRLEKLSLVAAGCPLGVQGTVLGVA